MSLFCFRKSLDIWKAFVIIIRLLGIFKRFIVSSLIHIINDEGHLPHAVNGGVHSHRVEDIERVAEKEQVPHPFKAWHGIHHYVLISLVDEQLGAQDKDVKHSPLADKSLHLNHSDKKPWRHRNDKDEEH